MKKFLYRFHSSRALLFSNISKRITINQSETLYKIENMLNDGEYSENLILSLIWE